MLLYLLTDRKENEQLEQDEEDDRNDVMRLTFPLLLLVNTSHMNKWNKNNSSAQAPLCW